MNDGRYGTVYDPGDRPPSEKVSRAFTFVVDGLLLLTACGVVFLLLAGW